MRTRMFWLSAALLLGAAAGRAEILTEWTLPTAGSNPFQITASFTEVFFVEFPFIDGTLDTRVGRLEPHRDVFTEWSLPFTETSPGDILLHVGDCLVYVTSANFFRSPEIGELDPATNVFTKWTLPVEGGPRNFAFDGSGNVFFTAHSTNTGNFVGRLEPSTGALTLWRVPAGVASTADDSVEEIATDAEGHAFFNVNGFRHEAIARLDPSSGVFTAWFVSPLQPVFGLETNPSGDVFFQEVAPGIARIARFAPSTSVRTEWSYPRGFNEDITVDPFMNVYATGADTVIGLDTTVAGVDTTLTPRTFGPVMPTITRSAPSSIVVRPTETRLTPVITRLAGSTSGALTTFSLPTAGSGPRFIANDGVGTVYFDEQPGNRIGGLRTVPPSGVVQSLEDQIGGLVEANVLDGHDGKKLNDDLDRVTNRLSHGDVKGTTRELNGFIEDVQDLVENDRLALPDARPLRDGAQDILNRLGC